MSFEIARGINSARGEQVAHQDASIRNERQEVPRRRVTEDLGNQLSEMRLNEQALRSSIDDIQSDIDIGRERGEDVSEERAQLTQLQEELETVQREVKQKAGEKDRIDAGVDAVAQSGNRLPAYAYSEPTLTDVVSGEMAPDFFKSALAADLAYRRRVRAELMDVSNPDSEARVRVAVDQMAERFISAMPDVEEIKNLRDRGMNGMDAIGRYLRSESPKSLSPDTQRHLQRVIESIEPIAVRLAVTRAELTDKQDAYEALMDDDVIRDATFRDQVRIPSNFGNISAFMKALVQLKRMAQEG